MRIVLPLVMAIICFLPSSILGLDALENIQNTSVTIKSGTSEGSGNIITRQIITDGDTKENVNFILTAGHVVDDLRSVREIVDIDGTSKKIVEFKDACVVKEFRQKGRRVGETKLDAKVLKFSDPKDGEDLALLMVVMYNFIDEGVNFYLNQDIPTVGTEFYHCGSLLGQMGANSMTTGIMSQIGRVYEGKIYDQSTVTAFPGSSGGGVFLVENNQAKYVGMVVRGSGETFNLLVPIRRITKWTKDNNIEWLVDPKTKPPTLKEIMAMPIEAGYDNQPSPKSVPAKEPVTTNIAECIFLDKEHASQWRNAIVKPYSNPE